MRKAGIKPVQDRIKPAHRPTRKKRPLKVDELAGFPHKGVSKAEQRRLIELMIPNKGVVFIPAHLHEDAVGCIEVIRESMPDGIYSKLDTFLLAGFACAWATHKRAAHEMCGPEFEYVVSGARGVQPNPWIKIMFEAGRQMATLSDRLGLNPSTRQAMRMPTTLEHRDPYEDLIELAA